MVYEVKKEAQSGTPGSGAQASDSNVGKRTLVDSERGGPHQAGAHAGGAAFVEGATPAAGSEDAEQANRDGLISNTLMDMWTGSIQIAVNNLTSFVVAKSPPPSEALIKAIISVGVEASAARIFTPLVDAVSGPVKKSIWEAMGGAYKWGLQTTMDGLREQGALRVDPALFARQWQTGQIEAMQQKQQSLVDALDSSRMSSDERRATNAKIIRFAPTGAEMTRILLQQYTQALYYHSGDDSHETQGMIKISINTSKRDMMSASRPDVDESGIPQTASVELVGVDSEMLNRMKRSLGSGINPMKLGIPFSICFWQTQMDGEAKEDKEGYGFKRKESSVYFNDGGRIVHSTGDASMQFARLGYRIPVAAGFGERQQVVEMAPSSVKPMKVTNE